MIRILAALAMLTMPAGALAARLEGRIADRASNLPVPGARLSLARLPDTTKVHGAVSDDGGGFAFDGLTQGTYRLDATRVGYAPLRQVVRIESEHQDAGTLLMSTAPVLEPEVVVHETPPTAVQKADTTEFAARAFKVNRDANAEDLVTKMPGITVDKSGTVTSNGETVRQVLLDGRPYFGSDPTAALRNLPADVIDKIQVYDQLSDQSQFTGFDDGQSVKTLNITLRPDRRRAQFGKLYGGSGSPGRYLAGGNDSFLRGPGRLSLIGLANNVNQQNFSGQDLLGVLNTSGQRGSFGGGPNGRRAGGGGGGGRGAGGFGGGGGLGAGGGGFGGGSGGGFANSGSFLVGSQDGVTTTESFGSDFAATGSRILKASGSYFFNHSENEDRQRVTRVFTAPVDSIARYRQDSAPENSNLNHRVDARFEWAPDSSNSFVMQPRLYFQDNHSASEQTGGNTTATGEPVNLAQNGTHGATSGYNLSNHLVMRHRFGARGRTISLDLGGAATLETGTSALQSNVQSFGAGAASDALDERGSSRTTTRLASARAVYTEPLGKRMLLQLNYSPSKSRGDADNAEFALDSLIHAYTVADTAQSSVFQTTTTAQSAGTGLRFRSGELNAALSVAFQTSTLRSSQEFPAPLTIERTFQDVLPSLTLNLNTKDHRNVRLSYFTSTRTPTVSQLQDVIDNSNPLVLTTGNPGLRQSALDTFVGRYSRTDPAHSRSLFLLLSLQHTRHYIGSQTVTALADSVVQGGILLPRGTQLVFPVNLSSAWTASTFTTYSRPARRLGSVLNLSAGLSYARTPGQIGAIESEATHTR